MRPVEFTDMTVTPYVDSTACRGNNKPHKCRGRLAWSYRAAELVAPGTTSTTRAAA